MAGAHAPAVAAASAVTLDVAAGYATDRVPIAAADDTVARVRAALLGASFRCAEDVAVLRADRTLAGLVPIERLLGADVDASVGGLMDADPPAVAPGADAERVAWKMVEHGESSIAVVDAQGRFAGLIPPSRMLAVLLAEHDEDLARLGGYLAGTQRARAAAEEPSPGDSGTGCRGSCSGSSAQWRRR
jgi:magnesium transporter